MNLLPKERIEQHIYFVRGHKIMLDSDLARLYAESGDIQHAAKVIEDVPEADRSPKMELALGAAFEQLKQAKNAIAAYQRADSLEPGDAHTLDELAQNHTVLDALGLQGDDPLEFADGLVKNIAGGRGGGDGVGSIAQTTKINLAQQLVRINVVGRDLEQPSRRGFGFAHVAAVEVEVGQPVIQLRRGGIGIQRRLVLVDGAGDVLRAVGFNRLIFVGAGQRQVIVSDGAVGRGGGGLSRGLGGRSLSGRGLTGAGLGRRGGVRRKVVSRGGLGAGGHGRQQDEKRGG